MWRAGVMVAVASAAAAGCHGGPGRCGRPTRAPQVEVVRCADGCGVPSPRVVTEVAPCPAPEPARPRLAFGTVRLPVPCLRVVKGAEPTPCAAEPAPPQVILAVPVAGYPFPAGFPAAAPPPAAAPAAPALTPDRVEAFTRRIEELEAQLRAAQPAGGTATAGGK